MRLVQHESKDKWAEYEPVLMPLADSTAVTRQVKIPICSKMSTRKTACLDLTRGPQPPQGTSNHVVKSDLALPAPYRLDTSKFTYSQIKKFTQSLHVKFIQSLHFYQRFLARFTLSLGQYPIMQTKCKPILRSLPHHAKPSANQILEHCTTPKLEMTIFQQPIIHLR